MHPLVALQTTIGNRAVTNLLVGRPVPVSRQEGNGDQPATDQGDPAHGWDGLEDERKREDLKNELLNAMQEVLNKKAISNREQGDLAAGGTVVPTGEQQKIGLAAKRYVDQMFGSMISSAEIPSTYEKGREDFKFEPGSQLLALDDIPDRDFSDDEPWNEAVAIAETDPVAREVQNKHGFDRNRSEQEEAFFNDVVNQFLQESDNKKHLIDSITRNRFYAMPDADPRNPKILTQTETKPAQGFSSDPNRPGEPSPAERMKRWSLWQALMHEYLHLVRHPSFGEAARGNPTLNEGLLEIFRRAVLVDPGRAIEIARSDGDPTLRHEVEGGDFPDFLPDFVPDYDPGGYAGYLADAEKIVQHHGIEAAKAAYFLGKLDQIGLQ